MDVAATIVTRGDVDLEPILASIPFTDIAVWNNALGRDLQVMGRYTAISETSAPIVYTQDDDSICEDIPGLLAAARPGVIVANMIRSRWGAYPDSCLLGWGSVFDRCLPAVAFARWRSVHPDEEQRLLVDCDVVFSALTPHVKLDLGVTHLPYARNRERMFAQRDHVSRREQTLRMARRVREEPAKLNLGSGAHPLPGFVNLDAHDGWRFEDGLGMFLDGSVEAVTVSHALMYLPLRRWPALFDDIARVLRRGGVFRVTEDVTDDPQSDRFGGFHDAVTLTTIELVLWQMRQADLTAELVAPMDGRDPPLVQRWHGEPPKVFHVEAVKP